MGRRKRLRALQWLGEENKQKKARRSNCQVPKFLQNFALLLTRFFCTLDIIAIASSARPTFASSLISLMYFHSLFAVFAFSTWSTEFSVAHDYL